MTKKRNVQIATLEISPITNLLTFDHPTLNPIHAPGAASDIPAVVRMPSGSLNKKAKTIKTWSSTEAIIALT